MLPAESQGHILALMNAWGCLMTQEATVTLTGVVEQIIEPVGSVPERAVIEIQGAEDLYSEIRIENALRDGDGQKVRLKLCEKVNVTIEKNDWRY
jgi:hypothetical protein